MRDGPFVEQEEMEMNTQNVEISVLSDDELDAVAGGLTNGQTKLFTAFYDGLYGALNQEGRNMLQDSFSKAQRAAGQ
jgi:hypothetical protein